MYTFSPNTQAKSAEINSNFDDLSSGAGDTTANSLKTFRDETAYDYVVSGMDWSADNITVNLNGSMNFGVAFINGRRLSISSINSRAFTASKDTYITILDNLDGTGTIVYTEVANGATAPSIPSDSIQLAMIVTNGTSITKVFDLAPRNFDELGRCKLIAGSGVDTLTVPNLPAKSNLRVTTFLLASGGTLDGGIRFNNDSGSNYNGYGSAAMGAGAATGATSSINTESGATDSGGTSYGEMIISNRQSYEKLYRWWNASQDAAGAATVNASYEFIGKWANTSAQISRIDYINTGGTGDFGATSEIIVKGYN